jgi:hypothetical protein
MMTVIVLILLFLLPWITGSVGVAAIASVAITHFIFVAKRKS